MYQTHKNLSNDIFAIVRESDMAWIPADPANSDYQRYLRWLENPNEVEHLTEIIPADEA